MPLNDSLHFDITGGTAPVNVTIDWGDGTPNTTASNISNDGTDQSFPHEFNRNGTWTATVTVTDNNGLTNTKTIDKTVSGLAEPEMYIPLKNSDVQQTFTVSWDDNGISQTGWWIYVGTSGGSPAYYNSGLIDGSLRTHDVTLSALPANNKTITITFYWRLAADGSWHNNTRQVRFTTSSSNNTPSVTIDGVTQDGRTL